MAMASRKRVATAVEPDDDIGCAFLHELSGEEQLRLRNRHLERKRKEKKLRDKGIRPAPSIRTMFPTRKQANRVSLNNRTSQSDSDIKKGNWCRDRDAFVMKNVHHALPDFLSFPSACYTRQRPDYIWQRLCRV